MRRTFTVPDEGVFNGQSNDNFELLKAWLGSTLAYAIFITGVNNLLRVGFVRNILIAAVVCGLAFVLHELAHRVVARKYGAQAHFIANNGWLLLSILLACAGVFVAAPGAVWHRGLISTRQGGLIALAGPVTNLVLSAIFFVVLAVLYVAGAAASTPIVPEWLLTLCYIGFSFNAWLGLFNMLPAGPFDGAKVLAWSPLVFGITVAVGVFMTFVLNNDSLLQRLLQTVLRLF